MKCPKCKNSALKENKVSGRTVRVDLCSSCKGFWFDRNELESLLNISVKTVKIPSHARKQPFQCPRCRKQLYAFSYPHTMVIVDMCPHCEGIWLDANEFKEIKMVYGAVASTAKQSARISCPKCGHAQDESNECVKCGIIFSKYHQTPTKNQMPQLKTAGAKKAEPPDSIKAKLLGFIDKSMDVLWA